MNKSEARLQWYNEGIFRKKNISKLSNKLIVNLKILILKDLNCQKQTKEIPYKLANSFEIVGMEEVLLGVIYPPMAFVDKYLITSNLSHTRLL